MTDEQSGFLIPAVKRIYHYVKYVLPMNWLGRFNSKFRNPTASTTECYVLICLGIEVLIGPVLLGLGQVVHHWAG